MSSTAVAGQRSAQSPTRAATQAQAALGRGVQAGGSMSRYCLYEIDGRWWRNWYPKGSSRQLWQDVETGAVSETGPAQPQEGSP